MRIISASRREDMPAFRMAEIERKFKEYGPDVFWVLWTKDPSRIAGADLDLKRVSLQLTVTGLGSSKFEPNVPESYSTWDHTVGLVLSGLDPALITWRLDPILKGALTRKQIGDMADRAKQVGITRCVISFPSFYPHVKDRWADWKLYDVNQATQVEMVKILSDLMAKRDITLFGCAQAQLAKYVQPSKCIDAEYLAKVTGYTFSTLKDTHQRPACGCSESVDIGQYSLCPAQCLYCYVKPPTQKEQKTLFI